MRGIAALLVALLLAGCAQPAHVPTSSTPATSTLAPTPTPTDPATRFGVALSPATFGSADFQAFFDEAKQVGSVVLWGGSADELSKPGSAPHAVAQLAQKAGLEAVIQVGYANASFDEARATKDLVDFAQARHPWGLAVGVEVNRLATQDPAFFERFASWYPDAYDALKAAAPQTRVFPTFQYETMKGETGGLFGANASGPTQWDLLARFAKRDLTAFTLYPTLAFRNVSAIPDDHLADAVAHADGHPLAYTETGSFASEPGGSPQQQARYVAWLAQRAPPTQPKLVVWLHLHDQPATPKPFGSFGLIGADGAKRPAYDAWRAWSAAS